MARVARFWLLSIVAAIAVVVSGLIVPEGVAVAEEPAAVAPALDSKPVPEDVPDAPDGDFLAPESVAVQEVAAEPVPEPQVEGVDRHGLTLVSRHEFENRPNGGIVRYNPASNVFGVVSNNSAPRTLFKPDPSVHGYSNNLEYFYAQF